MPASLHEGTRWAGSARPPAACVMRMSRSCASTGSGWLAERMSAAGSPVSQRSSAACTCAQSISKDGGQAGGEVAGLGRAGQAACRLRRGQQGAQHGRHGGEWGGPAVGRRGRRTWVMAAGRPWMAVWLASTPYCSWAAGALLGSPPPAVAAAAAVLAAAAVPAAAAAHEAPPPATHAAPPLPPPGASVRLGGRDWRKKAS